RPPEWIVDDDRSFECHPLQCRSIVRHFVRNAVDDQVVLWWVIVTNTAEFDLLRDHFALSPLVNLLNEGFGKRLFPAYENSYPLHCLQNVPFRVRQLWLF